MDFVNNLLLQRDSNEVTETDVNYGRDIILAMIRNKTKTFPEELDVNSELKSNAKQTFNSISSPSNKSMYLEAEDVYDFPVKEFSCDGMFKEDGEYLDYVKVNQEKSMGLHTKGLTLRRRNHKIVAMYVNR